MSRSLHLALGAALVMTALAQVPALRKGVSVQMPVTANAVAVPDADQADSLVIAVTMHGAVYLGAEASTPAGMSASVKADLEAHPGKRVYVKADARTHYTAVAEVLDALRKAGASTPVLLSAQHDAADASYVAPKGLEVLLPPPPDPSPSATLKLGTAPLSDAELREHARRDRPVVLAADGNTSFGNIVHVVDICRAEGVKAVLIPRAL
jgi:biopolymer transport protein ExbD